MEVVEKTANSQKTFQEIYKEQNDKKKKIVNLDSLEDGLEKIPPVGVNFIFRGKVFSFSNPDLVDLLK